MYYKTALLSLAGAMVLAIPASAEMHGKKHGYGHGQGGKAHGAHMMFNEADANGDDMVSREEFMAFHEDMFESADTNGDDMISRKEMMKKRAEMRKKRMKMMKDSGESEE